MFGSKLWEEIFGEQILLNGKKLFVFFFMSVTRHVLRRDFLQSKN